MEKVRKSDAEWRAELDDEQYAVLRRAATEPPFSGEYDHVFADGVYRCAGCGAELFRSESKYDPGCGWPAFYAPAGTAAIDEGTDSTFGLMRTEAMCSNCGAPIGDVSPGGPKRTWHRYCIASAARAPEGA